MRTEIALVLALTVVSCAFLPQFYPPLRAVTALSTLPSDMPVVLIVDDTTKSSDIRAEVGETFTIRVEVFNLTATEYITDDLWVLGEPLPPAVVGGRYKYLLGDLWAFDMRMMWDPTILEYVTHTVMVPVENYTGGILNGPVVEPNDDVDPVAGTYWLSRSCYGDATPFNAPGQNATAFTMTFNVKNLGKCDIRFTKLDLVVYPYPSPGFPTLQNVIPHWIINGQFQTGNLLTRVESIQAGALVAGSLYHPVIEGEDVTVRIAMRNDNDTVTDTYDLTLFDGTTVLTTWEDETLDPGEMETFTHTALGLGLGLHPLKAVATILHAGELTTSEAARNVTVIDTPTLQINGPSSAIVGQTVTFNASGSVHNDPNGTIVTYRWTLWAAGDPVARDTKTGESVSFKLPSQTEKIGNWTVMLVVTDNFGITARQPSETSPLGVAPTPTSDLLRPATEPYRGLAWLEVMEPLMISVLTPENKIYLADEVPLAFTLNRAALWMGYSLDGQANVTLSGNSTLTNLSHGLHTLRVFANTEVESVESATIYFSATDTTPPTVSVSSPENRTYATREVQLTFVVNEPVQWMGYSLDGQANVTVLTSSSLISGLSPGTYRIRVFAEDLHGNTGSSETICFTISAQPFSVELVAVVAIVAVVAMVAVVAVTAFAHFAKVRKGTKPREPANPQA